MMTVELLQENYGRKAAIKEKPLKLKMKLVLQWRKWLLGEEEWKKRLELDTEKMSPEAEECRAIIELLKKTYKVDIA